MINGNWFINQGWQCPVCGRVNAPSVLQCPCQGMIIYVSSGTSELTEHELENLRKHYGLSSQPNDSEGSE